MVCIQRRLRVLPQELNNKQKINDATYSKRKRNVEKKRTHNDATTQRITHTQKHDFFFIQKEKENKKLKRLNNVLQ